MTSDEAIAAAFPRALTDYPAPPDDSLWSIWSSRVATEPFNLVATAIFVLAIIHTFGAGWFTALSHRIQHRHDEEQRRKHRPASPSVAAELLHFFGEVEVVFGLWAIALLLAIARFTGWDTATHYFNGTVVFTEPMFVVVIMTLASTRPVVVFVESVLKRVAGAWGGTPAAWYISILIVGPLLGSFITEPGAMTISALLLARQFFDLRPSAALKYATLGLLFVNVSIGGTLTHFAAPPVLMVARVWNWDTPFMLTHFGARAVVAIVLSTLAYYLWFRREFSALAAMPSREDVDVPEADAITRDTPGWLTVAHIGFLAWTVFNAHYPVLFVGGFLIFIGFAQATAAHQSRIELKTPMLVGFFLAGLVIHGGLQAWWIAPLLGRLSELPLFVGATILTGFNDNALITYLGTLVPQLSDGMKTALVGGAVTGGGLTVIANAPNPAGQALLGKFYDGGVNPLKLFLGALLPTLIASLALRLW